ncbi:MAG: glycosyltransferase family 4 protein [Methanobacterium sp.]
MKSKKLKICLLLPDTFNPDLPARPAIIEIYGNCFHKHQITWIMSCFDDCDFRGEIFENVNIQLIPDNKHAPLLVRIYHFIRHYYKKFKLSNQIFKEEDYDLIQVRNDIWDSFLALYLKRKFKIPFVFQYTFPKNSYKFESSPRLFVKISGRIEEFLMKIILMKCDFIFPISDWMQYNILKEGVPPSKIMSLPMGANIHSFSPEVSGEMVIEKYGLSGSRVVLYAGSLDKMRKLEVIIQAFASLHGVGNECVEDIKLVLVGEGNDKADLESMVKKMGMVDRVIFTGNISYFRIPEFIAAADICLSPIPPLDLYKISSPTKLFEYMAMEKPVLANREIPEQERILEESEAGVLVDFNQESFTQGMRYLLDNAPEARVMGKNGRQWVAGNRSYDDMAEDIEKLYYRLRGD